MADGAGTNTIPAGLVVGVSPIVGGTNGRFLYDNNGVLGETSSAPASFFGNPTNPGVNLTGSNGVALTAMRSDAVLVLDQTITPTWTGLHTFNNGVSANTVTVTANGALSTPSFKLTGSVVSGGTGTTTQPLMLLQPAGQADAAVWNTGGTFLGFNGVSSGGGSRYFIQGLNNGVTTFYVHQNGTFEAQYHQFNNGAGSTTSYLQAATNGSITFFNTAGNSFDSLVFGGATKLNTLSFPASATFQFGAADVSSGAVAQTVQPQSNTGNNTTGPQFTIKGASGGASGGTGGDIFFSPGTGGAANGNVKFGTHSAIAAETVTGYITIKDAGGTLRKLAVVS